MQKDNSRNSSFEEAPRPPKKQSWWKKLIPSCGTNSRAAHKASHQEQVQGVVLSDSACSCGACGVVQAESAAPAFVCSACSKVNRIVVENPSSKQRRLSVCSDLGEEQKNRLVRTGSSTFEPISADVIAKEEEVVVPQCQVCMDGPGDLVLLPCGHGAICEPCAKHIAKNMSVGGNHCVKCRSEIKKLVRLDQLYKDQATGVTVIIPSSELRKGPPKVPPPPGLNKSKRTAPN